MAAQAHMHVALGEALRKYAVGERKEKVGQGEETRRPLHFYSVLFFQFKFLQHL